MSGSFEALDVPPTLVSFAVAMTKASKTVSACFRKAGSQAWMVPVPENPETHLPAWDKLKAVYAKIYEMMGKNQILSASVVREGRRRPRLYAGCASATRWASSLPVIRIKRHCSRPSAVPSCWS